MKTCFTVPDRPSIAAVSGVCAYNADNSLATVDGTAVAIDDDGNVTSVPLSESSQALQPVSTASLVWNARNELISATTGGATTTYGYDAEGRRVSKTTPAGTTTYIHSPGGALSQLLIEWLPGPGPGLSKRWFVHGATGIEYQVENDGTPYYLHGDQLGSVLAVTNNSGQVVKRWGYTPYGQAVSHAWTGAIPDAPTPAIFAGAPEHGYIGQWGVMTDANGLLNMRARYYSPYLRRFLNEDPIGFSGGMNWFGYAGGNPLLAMDPLGLKDDTTPFQLGQEWLTGRGPRHHDFEDGDPFTELLRSHSHLQTGFQIASEQAAAAAAQGQTSTAPIAYSYKLSGVQGVGKYLKDYSTIATAGKTGNLAVTFLGSYSATMNVSNINAQAGTANVQVVISNSSTFASGTRPPVLGYTNWWQQNVTPTLNSYFSSGAMSPTTQTITMNQTVNFAPVQSTTSNAWSGSSNYYGGFSYGGTSRK